MLQRGVPVDARLVVDFQRLAQALPQMPDELNRVVQLFDGRRSARQVLLDTPLNETLALEVMTRLYLMGVLTPYNDAARETIVLKQAPRLFEPRPTEADELMRSLFAGTAEIRADAFAPHEDADWYSPPTGAQTLEASAADAGWQATALADAAEKLTADLPDELARQIEAFGTTPETEPKDVPPAEQKLSLFSQGADAPVGPSIEEAFQQATGDADASLSVEAPRGFVLTLGAEPSLPAAVEPARPSPADVVRASKPAAAEVKAPLPLTVVYQEPSSVLPRANPDRQARIETPEMTPAVRVAQSAPDLALEDTFFAAQDTAVEAQRPVAEALPAVAQPRKRSRAGWLIMLGVVAVAVSVIVEWTMILPAPEAAPVPAPVLVAPRKVAPVAVAAPEPKVDPAQLEQRIADGRKAYDDGRLKDAVASLEAALDLDPTSVQAWLLLGLARYDSGNDAGAWEAVTMVQQLEPDNARAYLLKATMELQARDLAHARASVARYLELDPKGQFADEARSLVERLR